jgi:hypothetical protein
MYTCICACMSVYYEEDILWYSTMLILYTTAKVTKKNAECCLPLNVILRILLKKQTWVPAFWKTKGVVRFNMWRSLCLWLFLLTPLSHPKGHPNSSSDTLNTLGTTCHRYHQAFLS